MSPLAAAGGRPGRKAPPARAASVAGALLLLLPLLPSCSSSRAPGAAGGEGAAPELALEGVTVRHVAADGSVDTVEARHATYSLSDRTVAARDVVVKVPTDRGEAGLTAPEAAWGTGAGVLRFPAGASATLGGSYSASVAAGEVDLRAGLLRGQGETALRGPGFSVTGGAIQWDLKAGRGTLLSPRARISPAVLARRG